MNQSAINYTSNPQAERIKQERQRLGLTQIQLSEWIGVGKTTVINWEKEDGTSPNAIQMSKLLDFGFDIHFILTGSRNETNESNCYDHADDYEYIPVYDVEASAGFGMTAYGATAPVSHLAFRKDWLKMRGLYPKDLSIITAKGDSMEPTIESGNTLLVDASKSNPRDGHIYVILSNDALWVKRVQRQFDGSLLLLSDNPAYPPQTLDFKNHPDVQVIGQVVNVSKDLA